MNAPGKKPTYEELLAELAEAKEKLGHAQAERDEAQQMAAAMAEATAFGGGAEEQPTGRKIKVRKCLNPGERDEKKQKWHEVEVPTYFYTIDLPAGAGVALMTNGMEYYHGETYEFDPDSLADIKSRVARTWDHEKAIHSENENAYRRPQNIHLKSKAAAARGF